MSVEEAMRLLKLAEGESQDAHAQAMRTHAETGSFKSGQMDTVLAKSRVLRARAQEAFEEIRQADEQREG